MIILQRPTIEGIESILLENKIKDWNDIKEILSELKQRSMGWPKKTFQELLARFSGKVAFISFDYGIDGVSIEIAKYAECFEQLLGKTENRGEIHYIGGDFHSEANLVIKPEWRRYRIEGINGWNKWYSGDFFSKLFFEDMPEGSYLSKVMAKEIWNQASAFALSIATYLLRHNIRFICPVNISSNPGNPALQLAVILVSEILKLHVVSFNHDYYWEGGAPEFERSAGSACGVRDHFFKNYHNNSFFSVFEELFPWDGNRWIQVNINDFQSETLINKFGFSPSSVLEISTLVGDSFFKLPDKHLIADYRKSMGCILANGEDELKSHSIHFQLENLSVWMQHQHPILLGAETGISLDLASEDTMILLQPTRVVSRKRIERNFHLLQNLVSAGTLHTELLANPELRILVHITGPTPIEHEAAVRTVLSAYQDFLESVPELKHRFFLSFSVGTEEHPCFKPKGLTPLKIENLYQMSNAVLFPSETEGRGLPIIESSACGIPIICSRYFPEEVFDGVVGAHLPAELQIWYTPFPEKEFDSISLNRISDILFNESIRNEYRLHNQKAVHSRYSTRVLKETLIKTLNSFEGEKAQVVPAIN